MTVKNYIALMLLLLVGGFATAQQNPIDRYFTKYQEDTSFTSIELSGKMFQMVNHIEAETEEEARNEAFADVQENHWTFWDEQDGDIEVFEAIEVTGDE